MAVLIVSPGNRYRNDGTSMPLNLTGCFEIGFSRVHSSVAPTVLVLNCGLNETHLFRGCTDVQSGLWHVYHVKSVTVQSIGPALLDSWNTISLYRIFFLCFFTAGAAQMRPATKTRPKLNTNPSKVQSTKPKSWLKRVAFSKYRLSGLVSVDFNCKCFLLT
jgi:hypothetical protein